jgi:hypothetical protein
MTAILLALGSSVGYGVSDFLASRVARRVAPVLLVLYSRPSRAWSCCWWSWPSASPTAGPGSAGAPSPGRSRVVLGTLVVSAAQAAA